MPFRTRSRANSDVSQMSDGTMGTRVASPDSISSSIKRSSSADTAQDVGSPVPSSLPATKSTSPAMSPERPPIRQAASSPGLPARAPQAMRRPVVPGDGMTTLKGTIARGTVDTMLAMIPAKAFNTLTKKYPKASGTVVQVVLERFSRVTFMTGEYQFRAPLTRSTQIPRSDSRNSSFRIITERTRVSSSSLLVLHEWRHASTPASFRNYECAFDQS